jgi:hypothetical protein
MAEMIDECLHEENIPLERVNVTSARFRMGMALSVVG